MAVGEISKSKTDIVVKTSANLDVEVIFDQKVAASIVWSGITIGATPGTFQLQASQDGGSNFSDIGSAVTLTTGGNAIIESNNFPGSTVRVAYVSGTETAATGTIVVNLMAAKPIS